MDRPSSFAINVRPEVNETRGSSRSQTGKFDQAKQCEELKGQVRNLK